MLLIKSGTLWPSNSVSITRITFLGTVAIFQPITAAAVLEAEGLRPGKPTVLTMEEGGSTCRRSHEQLMHQCNSMATPKVNTNAGKSSLRSLVVTSMPQEQVGKLQIPTNEWLVHSRCPLPTTPSRQEGELLQPLRRPECTECPAK